MVPKLTKKKLKSEILTVMFVDLSKYTEISSNLDKEEFNDMHDTFDSICMTNFEEFEGNIIKKIGDAFLTTFRSPTNALDCAVSLQKTFEQYNIEENPKYKLKIKVAIHSGEVLLRDNDVFGDVVNIVSRLSNSTPKDQIYFTKAVYLSINESKLSFSSVGFRKFKGVKKETHVFRVNWNGKKNITYDNFKSKINSKILEYLAIFIASVVTSLILNRVLW